MSWMRKLMGVDVDLESVLSQNVSEMDPIDRIELGFDPVAPISDVNLLTHCRMTGMSIFSVVSRALMIGGRDD